MLSDLVLGFFISKLLGKNDGAAATQSPRVVLPNGNGHAHAAAAHAHAAAHHAAHAHAHHAATQPTFPAAVVPSGGGPDPGMKKAVEVWAIRPDVASATGNPVLTGLVGVVNDATALAAVEASFPAGWAPVQRVTSAEQAMAISLLKSWHNGGVVFWGPDTLPGKRAFRMTQHPASATQPQPAPVPVPTQPGATVPAGTTVTPPIIAPAPAAAAPILKSGSSGDLVKVLQTKLKAWGTFTKLTVDGKFGPVTKAAVITVQNAHSLTPDGIVGPQTWAVLGGTDPSVMPAPATAPAT